MLSKMSDQLYRQDVPCVRHELQVQAPDDDASDKWFFQSLWRSHCNTTIAVILW